MKVFISVDIEGVASLTHRDHTKLEGLEVDFIRPIHAQLAADIPGVKWIGGRKVSYTSFDMLELTRVWRVMRNLSMGERFV